MNLKNKKVTIIGFGRSGLALAELVLHFKGRPKISEQAPREKFSSLLSKWPLKEKVVFEFGAHTERFICDSDLVVLSPGVRIDAPPVLWAKAKKIPAVGEVELASRFCSKPVVAVTGSNGKTTVATLIAKVLEKGRKKVSLCGNIGSPFSKHVLALEDKDAVVLEISSFQLESIVDFKPHVAVWTNFSQNHLDRHKNIEEYFEAKKRIFLNQTKKDFAVLNFLDKGVKILSKTLKAKAVFFNAPDILKKTPLKNPNYLAALAVGNIFGISEKLCLEVFEEFKGVEHRLEWVRSIGGIDFFNDSKATTAEAGRWALNTIEQPIVMICGGRDKNIDFSVLRDLVKQKVKKMIVIGEAKEKLRNTFKDVVDIASCATLRDAIVEAKKNSKKGDCIVFSPMCASFDMFTNYEERGQVFKDIVTTL